MGDDCRCVERIDALDRLVETKFLERDRQVEAALEASKEASAYVSAAHEERLRLLNEFRGQAADEAKKYALREVVKADVERLEDQIANNAKLISTLHGRALALGGIGAVVGAVAYALLIG